MFIYPVVMEASSHPGGVVVFRPRRRVGRVLGGWAWSRTAPAAKVAEVSPKGPVEKHVEQRVDAAVGGGDDSRHLDAPVQVVAALAVLQGEVVLERGQEERGAVGPPHQKEDQHDGGNELAKVTAPAPGPRRFPHPHAANEENQQRNEKTHDVHPQGEEILPGRLVPWKNMQSAEEAPVLSASGLRAVRQEFGRSDQNGCCPRHDTRDGGAGHRPAIREKAPFVEKHSQKDTEQHLAVQAHGGERGDDLTRGVSQQPPVQGAVNPDWQGEQEAQVGDCQVEEINIFHVPESFGFYPDEHHQAVAQETDREHRGVELRHELGRQDLGVVAVALFCCGAIQTVVDEDVVIAVRCQRVISHLSAALWGDGTLFFPFVQLAVSSWRRRQTAERPCS